MHVYIYTYTCVYICAFTFLFVLGRAVNLVQSHKALTFARDSRPSLRLGRSAKAFETLSSRPVPKGPKSLIRGYLGFPYLSIVSYGFG